MFYDLGRYRVTTSGDAFFVAPTAAVIGRVTLGRDANIWFSTVLRGDTNTITIGERTNVQDNAVVTSMTTPPPSSATRSRSATAPRSMAAASASAR
jgi:carbonic anhydrase/acetyltransferase-like protein (isoleucine patch superfamily)